MNAASTHDNCKDSWAIPFQLEFPTTWKLGSLKPQCLGSRNRDLLRVCLIYLAVYPAIYPFWLVIVAPKQIEKVMVTVSSYYFAGHVFVQLSGGATRNAETIDPAFRSRSSSPTATPVSAVSRFWRFAFWHLVKVCCGKSPLIVWGCFRIVCT